VSGEIRVRGVTKIFEGPHGDVQALAPIDLTIAEGQFLCIVGPSGCGKTTLLRIIAGLAAPTEGEVDFSIEHDGKPLRSVVFQEQGIFPWMSVLQNTAFGLKVRGIGRAERERTARAYLDMLGLTQFADAYPRQLSGGMRQRVCIARTLVLEPRLILLDEPFGALDQQTRLVMGEELLRLWRETGATVLLITHSLDEAAMLSERIGVMSARPGRFIATLSTGWPRERDSQVVNDPRFGALTGEMWTYLRAESLRSIGA
jgi:NitT/TauT family transport system ATP-binding protein